MTIMQRRKTPAGAEKRRKVKHVYTLRFDTGPDQTIKAIGPTEAVAARAGGPESRLPYQITDETLMNRWLGAMSQRTTDAMAQAATDRAAALARRDDFTPRWLAPARDTTGGAL